MRTTRACGILLGLVLGVLPLPAAAQATNPPSGVKILGRILDSESRAPIDLVEVVVVGGSSPVYTDEKGRFVFESIAPGTYTLSATRLGFAPL
ncbi:MAG TPA: carboxypeptidase-like regulatory domain-containing protein, partial [Verrucomicrobiae bacterium]|nr:carboxypeptidase-like regulatory domain-containing protein [Verrucomicrobiae bacterium]